VCNTPDNQAVGINDAHQIAGDFTDSSGINGINDRGQLVGYYNKGEFSDEGFIYSKGHYTTVDYPGASQTVLQGINDAGQIVGWYVDDTANHGTHGFLADPVPSVVPVPSTWFLMLTGTAFLAFASRTRIACGNAGTAPPRTTGSSRCV
jgi:hypothetical protein